MAGPSKLSPNGTREGTSELDLRDLIAVEPQESDTDTEGRAVAPAQEVRAATPGGGWRPLPARLGFRNAPSAQAPAPPPTQQRPAHVPAGGARARTPGWGAPPTTPAAPAPQPGPVPYSQAQQSWQRPWEATAPPTPAPATQRPAYSAAETTGLPAYMASAGPGGEVPYPGAPGAAPPYGGSLAPAPPSTAGPVADDFADEATEVYGDDDVQGSTQVKGRLAVLEGELAGHWFTLLGSEIQVGRSDDNHLVIPDLAASRHHVRLTYSQGAYRLTDMSSGNGTYVNGIRVEEATLRDGDQIEVGRSIFEFLTTERSPGPVRFRRGQLMLAPPPGGGPGAAPLLPPATGAVPGAIGQVAPAPQRGLPLPPQAALPQPLASPQPPQQQLGPAALPQMQFPQPAAYPAAATPHAPPARRSTVPLWAVIIFGVLGLGVVALLVVVGYHVVGGWSTAQPDPYDRAHAAFTAKRWDEALILLKAVPADSEHLTQAQTSAAAIIANRDLFEQAKQERDEDRLEEAVATLARIAADAPYSADAAALRKELEAEVEAREAAEPKRLEVEPGSPLDRALAPYRAERLTKSRNQLRRLKDEPRAAELAEKVDSLLGALRNGRNALRRKEHSAAANALEQARILDLELGGALQDKIVADLVRALAALVAEGMEGASYRKVAEAMRSLRKVAGDHPTSVALQAKVSQRAKELVAEGIQLRDVVPGRAKRRLKQVLELVPPDDPSYARAKRALSKPFRYR